MTSENTCSAARGSLVCTLHRGHKGTHYDSLRDASFAEPLDPDGYLGAPPERDEHAERQEVSP
jgi:hypothetical protein